MANYNIAELKKEIDFLELTCSENNGETFEQIRTALVEYENDKKDFKELLELVMKLQADLPAIIQSVCLNVIMKVLDAQNKPIFVNDYEI